MRLIISLIHIFITGLFLLFIGWKQNDNPSWAYWVALILGVAVFFVWAIRFKKTFMSIVHLLLVVPLLVTIGVLRNKSPIYLYKISIMIGSAAIGYHIISLLKHKFN